MSNVTSSEDVIAGIKGVRLIFAAIYEVIHPGKIQFSADVCAVSDQTFLTFKNPMLGSLYLLLGIIYLTFYIPCVIVMQNYYFLQHSCYKIMYAMAITDVATLLQNAILTGYLLMIGGSVCNYPLTVLFAGSVGLGLWCGYCCLAVFLGVSRCIDMSFPKLGKVLFAGNRTWYWLALPLVYGSYFFFFEPAPVFHPFLAAWFFDIDPFTTQTLNYMHAFNNLFGTGTVCILNMAMSYHVYKMMHRITDKVSKQQVIVMLQCLIICMSMMSASVIYVLMQFVGLPPIFTIISQILWQFSNGGPGLMYVIVNTSIRNRIINLFVAKENMRSVSMAGGPSRGSAMGKRGTVDALSRRGTLDPIEYTRRDTMRSIKFVE